MRDKPNLAVQRRVADEVAAEWSVGLGPQFELARYSFVAPAGENAILKVTPAGDDESDDEADALALWNGDGAVRLLRRDHERRALLLERARPGTDLADVAEADANAIAVAVARRLWTRGQSPGMSPGLSQFRSVHDHVPRWLANAGAPAFVHDLYERLEKRADTLVHGDFHHHNVLCSDRGWLAIDPKPYLAEPEYDVASFLWNPLPARLRHVERRIAAFAAAGLDEERIRVWTIIRGAYLQPQLGDGLRPLV